MHFIIFTVMVLSLTSFSQVINVKGRVMYENGTPVAGVVAALRDLPMSDTTGSDGIYHITVDPVSTGSFGRQAENPLYRGGRIYFRVPVHQAVSVDIYDLGGKRISRLYDSYLEQGGYSINPHSGLESHANSLLIAQLKIGGKITRHKFLNLTTNTSFRLLTGEEGGHTALLKAASSAGIDELRLIHNGEILITHEINSYVAEMPDYVIYNLPYVPSSPVPANNAVDLETELSLSWTGGDPNPGDVTYEIFLDSINPPVFKFAKIFNITNVRISNLKSKTAYYWKIVASDGENTTEGPVWTFTTKNNFPEIPSNPQPADSTGVRGPLVTLSWIGGDKDPEDNVTYNILIGNQNPPTIQVASAISETSYTISGLDKNVTYYWRIIPNDGSAVVFGPVWSFVVFP